MEQIVNRDGMIATGGMNGGQRGVIITSIREIYSVIESATDVGTWQP